MPDNVLYIALVVAVGSIFIAFLTRKQLLNSMALATETASRLDKAKKKNIKLEGQVASQAKTQEQLNKAVQNLEKKLADTQKKNLGRDDELEKMKETMEAEVAVASRKTDHAEEQLQAMTAQLAEAVRDKKDALNTAKELSGKAVSREELSNAKAEVEKLGKLIHDLKKQNKSMKHQVEKAREVLSKVKPGELKRFKVKSTRMEQLYTSMKGLREMAEERNHNWETALRLMSSHITGKTLAEGESTAPLVGEALEKLGVVLMTDEHTEVGDDAIDLLSADIHKPTPQSHEVVETV